MQREEGLFVIFTAITFSSLVEEMNRNEVDCTQVVLHPIDVDDDTKQYLNGHKRL